MRKNELETLFQLDIPQSSMVDEATRALCHGVFAPRRAFARYRHGRCSLGKTATKNDHTKAERVDGVVSSRSDTTIARIHS